MLNFDTHVLLYAVTGEVTARESRILRAARWGDSAIVLWELAKLAQLGASSLTWTIPSSTGSWLRFRKFAAPVAKRPPALTVYRSPVTT
jgi:hypothetical protein